MTEISETYPVRPQHSRLLIDEPPLQVLPSLAVLVGLNEALFLQQLHYWLGRATVERDGKRWVYNTLESWQEQFPWCSVVTIKRMIRRLREQELILVRQLSEDRRDKTNYYTINYDVLPLMLPETLVPEDLMGEKPYHHGISLAPSNMGSARPDDEINLTHSSIRQRLRTETTTERAHPPEKEQTIFGWKDWDELPDWAQEKLRQKWAGEFRDLGHTVEEHVGDALNHVARKKALNTMRYLDKWLRGDLARLKAAALNWRGGPTRAQSPAPPQEPEPSRPYNVANPTMAEFMAEDRRLTAIEKAEAAERAGRA